MPFPLLLDVLAGLTCALALGGKVFFASVFAPCLLRELPTEVARPLLLSLLPDYYMLNAALTATAALLLWRQAESAVLALVCALFVFVRYALMPRIERARDLAARDDPGEALLYRRLHRLDAVIGLAQTAAVALVLARILAGAVGA